MLPRASKECWVTSAEFRPSERSSVSPFLLSPPLITCMSKQLLVLCWQIDCGEKLSLPAGCRLGDHWLCRKAASGAAPTTCMHTQSCAWGCVLGVNSVIMNVKQFVIVKSDRPVMVIGAQCEIFQWVWRATEQGKNEQNI